MSDVDKSFGQIAYEAYCARVDWKSVTGVDLPSYESQSMRLRVAWEAGAAAAVRAYMEDAASQREGNG